MDKITGLGVLKLPTWKNVIDGNVFIHRKQSAFEVFASLNRVNFSQTAFTVFIACIRPNFTSSTEFLCSFGYKLRDVTSFAQTP
jgi:hypothetical protein